MPKRLKAKNACINVENGKDQINCFAMAILSVLHYDDVDSNHRTRPTQYLSFINKYKWRPELFPMTAKNIKTFEDDNAGIKINLLHWNEANKENPIRPIYLTDGEIKKDDRLVVLLAYDIHEQPSHYVGVVHFNRLFSSKKHEHIRCER